MQAFFLHTGLAGFKNLLQQKLIAITAIVYFVLSLIIFHKYGINTNGEAVKYIDDASRILNGNDLRSSFFSSFYIVYSLLIAVFLKLNLSLSGVAFIQIIFAFIAACCMYKILLNELGNKRISFFALVFYLICLPIQKWNFFLYTESLHTSFVVIGLYFLYCLLQKKQFERWWIFLLLLLLIIFSRPVGMIFLIAFVFIFLVWLKQWRSKVFFYSCIALSIIIIALLLQSKFIFYFNPDSLRRMEIICQVPAANVSLQYKEYNNAGLSAFLHVITDEIGVNNFLFLGLQKVASFFGLIRSFYSSTHNALLIGTAILLYPLAIIGLFFRTSSVSYLKIFSIFYIIITTVGIFFTCDEWSNRFIAPVLPFIIILSALGLNVISSVLRNRIQNKSN